MAYTDLDANYDVFVERYLGISKTATGMVPVVSCSIGEALYRAMLENPGGLLIDAFGTGLPGVALMSIPTGFRAVLTPAHQPSDIHKTTDYLTLDSTVNQESGTYDTVVVLDPDFDSGTPTIAAPTLKEWAEAFGGIYLDQTI